jgi:signal peptidase I
MIDESATALADESPRVIPRRPWLAALLNLLFSAPIGQIYAGRLRRSVVLWCATGLLLPILPFALLTISSGQVAYVLLLAFPLGIPAFLAIDAYVVARRSRQAPLKRYQRWWVYLLSFGVFVAANQVVSQAAKQFIAEAFVFPIRSMSPTILFQDRILVDKLWFDASRIQRNDVVVFRVSEPELGSDLDVDWSNWTHCLSRVVGLPDDEVEIRNERVFINGQEWDDPHAAFDESVPDYPGFDMENHGPIIVPHDCCFVLGDNRRNAMDSRHFGPIPLVDLFGQARFVYWSRDYTFPDPNDRSSAVRGAVRRDRIGKRLD